MRQDGVATVPAKTPRKRWRVRRAILPVLVVLVVLLVAARLALPWWLQRYVNKTIDQSPDYDGRVGEIEVHLLRGAYTINDLKIVKTQNTIPVPFFEGKRVDFALDYNALTKGALRGEITMIEPRLNFVDGETEDEDQTGAGQPWLGIIEELYPFRIDKATVVDGRVHFRAFHKDPEVDVYLSDVQATLENLTNIEDKTEPLMANLKARARAMRSGDFELDMAMDPSSHRPHLQLALRLLNLDVNQLNALARAYGNFDFEGGQFDLAAEVATKDGFVDGYAKPLFRNVQVISLQDAKEDNPLEFFWEALVGTVGEVLTNQPHDQFGTRITIEGELDDPRTSVLEIIGNVLKNAFVRAYLPRLEGRTAPATRSTEGDGS
jgi:hypothetical protein